MAEWRQVFWVTFGVFAFTSLQFVLFASGELQPWNSPKVDVKVNKDDEKKNCENNVVI